MENDARQNVLMASGLNGDKDKLDSFPYYMMPYNSVKLSIINMMSAWIGDHGEKNVMSEKWISH